MTALPRELARKQPAQVAQVTYVKGRHPDTGAFLAVRGGPKAGNVLWAFVVLIMGAMLTGLLLSLL